MRSSPTRAASVKPTLIDYVQDRNGKVIYRTDNRCAGDGELQRRRLGRQGDAAPALARRARCSIRWPRSRWSTSSKASSSAAPRPYCATSTGRCSARPARPPARPTSGSSAARPTSSPASISATTSRGPMGGYAPGRADRRADLQAIGAGRAQGRAEGAVRRACRASAGSASTGRAGGACSAPSRRKEDPKSAVIWEAFQPQTEPRRFVSPLEVRSACRARRAISEGDAIRHAARAARPRARAWPAHAVRRSREPQTASLQTQTGIY